MLSSFFRPESPAQFSTGTATEAALAPSWHNGGFGNRSRKRLNCKILGGRAEGIERTTAGVQIRKRPSTTFHTVPRHLDIPSSTGYSGPVRPWRDGPFSCVLAHSWHKRGFCRRVFVAFAGRRRAPVWSDVVACPHAARSISVPRPVPLRLIRFRWDPARRSPGQRRRQTGGLGGFAEAWPPMRMDGQSCGPPTR
jgi:hypothetical protein